MKKVLFMLISMNVGGTEKAFLNMLQGLMNNGYDVTILLLEKRGQFLGFIPGGVHIKYLEGFKDIKDMLFEPLRVTALDLLRKRRLARTVVIILLQLVVKVTNDKTLFFRYMLKDYPDFGNIYDIAVAYAGPMDFISYYVLYKIKAKKKIQWIHFDATKVGFNRKLAARLYKCFDKIFTVSAQGKDKLLEIFPELKDKVQEFYNIITPCLIRELADEGKGFCDDFDGFRILTVGRLSREKGQDLTVPVMARLKQEGYYLKWYCIGDGDARTEYKQMIDKYFLENDFILLGATVNPYPYMKQCDIYVQPSRHEGYCITLAEARCFANPIVTTNFTGAGEQIIHEQTGLIAECKDQNLYSAIKRLLDDEELRNKIKTNLRCQTADNVKEMEKFYKIAGDID